ncbi:hypothetical protein EGR_11023 [Echinococcus granulosus]|uniref:Uncharacterized protein n=1 Tax=Echinococcus granulosus TaxID=6210 RepID=W6U6W2_ECHGR|nr:hypothetical protein EGR_11023 [Echinococcus granulosus]EUB54117.1 hypothetical protein EGR_11023 [Echinococcus granulosus]
MRERFALNKSFGRFTNLCEPMNINFIMYAHAQTAKERYKWQSLEVEYLPNPSVASIQIRPPCEQLPSLPIITFLFTFAPSSLSQHGDSYEWMKEPTLKFYFERYFAFFK